jgi:putative endonuclease
MILSGWRPNVPTFGTGGERLFFMWVVYILKDSSGKLYKGMTSNLSRRLKEHVLGKTRTTARMSNFTVIYQEEFTRFAVARKREVYFKSAAGRRYLKKQLRG